MSLYAKNEQNARSKVAVANGVASEISVEAKGGTFIDIFSPVQIINRTLVCGELTI